MYLEKHSSLYSWREVRKDYERDRFIQEWWVMNQFDSEKSDVSDGRWFFVIYVLILIFFWIGYFIGNWCYQK